jgi:Beta-ketoacyl synthase, N-terminal domain
VCIQITVAHRVPKGAATNCTSCIGLDTITAVPLSRWDMDGAAAGIMGFQGRFGSFVAGVDEFDPAAFGISANEAELMDPQQRLLLMARALSVCILPCFPARREPCCCVLPPPPPRGGAGGCGEDSPHHPTRRRTM